MIGLAAGIASGFFGIGGGIVIVPMLAFFMGYGIQQAAATSLAALLLPVGALGVLAYWKAGILTQNSLIVALWIATGLFLGVFAGAKIAMQISTVWLSRAFAIFLVFIAARIWLKAS